MFLMFKKCFIIQINSFSTIAKNTVISRNFLVWKFCAKAQFQQSIGRNYAETVPLHKVSTPGNQVKLRHFLQWSLFFFCRNHIFWGQPGIWLWWFYLDSVTSKNLTGTQKITDLILDFSQCLSKGKFDLKFGRDMHDINLNVTSNFHRCVVHPSQVILRKLKERAPMCVFSPPPRLKWRLL